MDTVDERRDDQGGGRVVVGVSGTISSLEALRVGAAEAHRTGRSLVTVLAWTPPGGEIGYRRAPVPELLKAWEQAAVDRLEGSFDDAFGGLAAMPQLTGGLTRLVVRGEPGHALVQLADRPDDLLVLGAGERGWPARWLHGAVSRFCVKRAGCRVLAVPPPALLTALPARQRHQVATRTRMDAAPMRMEDVKIDRHDRPARF
ncbi:universal stress protein [Streptacidiphilus sp. MAP5-3]|uniref:universal stress protein n=1 Tax=unclassified Streptacidiphilus TaxID=2643834 RepID=UPI003513062D